MVRDLAIRSSRPETVSERARSSDLSSPSDVLGNVVASCRRALLGTALLSGVINVLYLTGSLFMLEVYDRVIPSRSVPTLVALGVIAGVLYLFQGLLELLRGRVFVRIGAMIDRRLSARVYDLSVDLSVRQRAIDPLQPGRDLDQIRQFLWNSGPAAFFDLPWIPVYVGICFLFHAWLGMAAIVGALILVTLTWLTERGAKGAGRRASAHAGQRGLASDTARRNAEVIRALGMLGRLRGRWETANVSYLSASGRSSDVVAGFGSLAKVTRTALQSFVLALGAYLVIHQEATGGVMIASSILVARALAPVDLVIGQWKGFVAARLAFARLREVLAAAPVHAPMQLQPPSEVLTVQNVTLVPPGAQATSVVDVSFALERGDALGVIGSSASGKSSLARALVGVWTPVRGAVRMDGAALTHWDPERLGPHLGYMPQTVELFSGSVAENIARFEPDFSPDTVVAAAKAAGIHDLVLALPNGYDTPVGEGGGNLSAGQRQRVALARALYGDPFLVVLDEPNSNLDAEGDIALTDAILGVRHRGGIVVIVAHRPSAITACNLLLVMAGGRCQMFGPKDEVLAAMTRRAAPPPPPARTGPQPIDFNRAAS